MGLRAAKFFVMNNKPTLFGGTATEVVTAGFRIEYGNGDDEVVTAEELVGILALSTSKHTRR